MKKLLSAALLMTSVNAHAITTYTEFKALPEPLKTFYISGVVDAINIWDKLSRISFVIGDRFFNRAPWVCFLFGNVLPLLTHLQTCFDVRRKKNRIG